ncbi:MAG: hypothetical protein LBL90_06185 [Prevotellaceae bacterium]|nr:hypothetical protein [Prevotellaceae bacterium]
MPLLNYVAEFRDEAVCKLGYKEYHDMRSVIFRQCGSHRLCWKQDKGCCENKQSRTGIGMKSGTVMHKTKQPYHYCFIAKHL